jgi:hypothetical protein
VSGFTSALVKDENGQICLQVELDGHVAVHPLPFGFGRRDDDEVKAYLSEVVPEILRRLIHEKNTLRRKINREAGE